MLAKLRLCVLPLATFAMRRGSVFLHLAQGHVISHGRLVARRTRNRRLHEPQNALESNSKGQLSRHQSLDGAATCSSTRDSLELP